MKVIAHRGFSEKYPENSLIAFEKAIEVGVDGIETDVRMSADGIPFIFHDSSLERITGNNEALESQKSDYLQGLDIGSWFDARYSDQRLLTLSQFLDCINGQTMIILEIKYHEDSYEAVSRCVVEYISDKLSWIEVSSFSDAILTLIHELNPDIRLHKLIDERSVLQQNDFDALYSFAAYFDIDVKLKEHPKTQALLQKKRVVFWTVAQEDLKPSIAMGLWGAMSNDPVALRASLL
jgi:glycerophosphoryl diester phosphodiesterase